jgi:hypothetical protein
MNKGEMTKAGHKLGDLMSKKYGSVIAGIKKLGISPMT